MLKGTMNNKVAVLIPAYNEATTIKKVIEDFRKALPNAKIYIYDNNSTDDTNRIVARCVAANPRHVYLSTEPRQGKGNVVRTMFRQIRADAYVLVDGDDTYPASMAPEMVNLVLKEHADMVIGDRLSSTYFTENKRRFHNSGNKLVKFLINRLFRANIQDIMTGYRAFSREFVKGFPILSKGFEIETEMTIHAVDKNLYVKEIPVEYQDRPTGSTSKLNTYSDGLRVLKTIFVLFKDYRPLMFFGLLFLFLLLISGGLGVWILVDYFETGLVERFPTLFVAVAIGIAAILSLFTGLLLDTIAKKHRQLYEIMMNVYWDGQNDK